MFGRGCREGLRGFKNHARNPLLERIPSLSYYYTLRNGGRGGIRTPGAVSHTLDFESSALSRTQPPFRGFAGPGWMGPIEVAGLQRPLLWGFQGWDQGLSNIADGSII